MNSGLIYLTKKRLKNFFIRLKKKPMKFIGTLVSLLYFGWLATQMGSYAGMMRLESNYTLILVLTGMNIYLFLPSILTYLKQKGLMVRKGDVHYIFATPVPPKQFIIYALFVSGFASYIFIAMMLVFGLSIYSGPAYIIIGYFIINFIINSLYDVGIVMTFYASESITPTIKKMIRYGVYIFLFILTLYVGITLSQANWSLEVLQSIVTSSWFMLLPYIGWQTAFMDLFLVGPSTVNIIGSLLYLGVGLGLIYYAYKMKCTGKYYEGASKYSEVLEKAYANQKSGKITFSNSEKKTSKQTKDKVQGKYASTIFYNAIIKFKRERTLIQFGKVLMWIGIIAIGILIGSDIDNPSDFIIYFAMGIPIAKAFMIMTPTNQYTAWQQNYLFYVLPDSMNHKIFFMTLFNNLVTAITGSIIYLIVGVVVGASFINILCAIIIYVLFTVTLDYVSLLTQNLLVQKLGQMFGVWAYMFGMILVAGLIILPSALIWFFSNMILPSTLVFIIIALGISYLCIYLAGKLFTFQEHEDA